MNILRLLCQLFGNDLCRSYGMECASSGCPLYWFDTNLPQTPKRYPEMSAQLGLGNEWRVSIYGFREHGNSPIMEFQYSRIANLWQLVAA